jgi:hypothetical protein
MAHGSKARNVTLLVKKIDFKLCAAVTIKFLVLMKELLKISYNVLESMITFLIYWLLSMVLQLCLQIKDYLKSHMRSQHTFPREVSMILANELHVLILRVIHFPPRIIGKYLIYCHSYSSLASFTDRVIS